MSWRRGVVAGALASAGCIIPDTDIKPLEEFANPGAVRIVQPTPVTVEADEACDDVPLFQFCPTFPETVPTGELAVNGDLCICTARDDNAPQSFPIYVEDPDVDDLGKPLDDIFGAFFLDLPPDATDLQPYLAYTNALSPDDPAARAQAEARAIERDAPPLRQFQVGGFLGGTFDVCNDNNGAKLSAGLHELRLIVTDRPWFAPLVRDDEGKPVKDADGNEEHGDSLIGVPDLSAGATYDTTAFVFRCHLESAMEEGVNCGCFDPEAG